MHVDGDQQLRRGAAGVDAEFESDQRLVPPLRRPVVSGRLPVRRKRIFHQTSRARLWGETAGRHRARDVPPGRRLHNERQEGRLGEHRRVSGYE